MTDARHATIATVGRVAGLAAIAVLVLHWFTQPVPLSLKALTALVLTISLKRPESGLLVFAGLAPLSTAVAALLGGAGLGARLLEQMALSVGAGAVFHWSPREPATRIGLSAALMAMVAVTSAGTLAIVQASTLATTAWEPLLASATIVECALLAWSVERIVRHAPPAASRLVLLALIGHAGAAALSLNAVVGGALRTGELLDALPRLLMSVRVNAQTDPNAGASALLLAGVAGLGLLGGTGLRRWGAGALVTLVAAGLWATSSRSAIVLAAAATITVAGWFVSRRRRWGRLAVTAAVAIALAAGVWFVARYPEGRNDTASGSISSRMVLVSAGLEMFRTAPLFGIGLTHFYATSAEVVGPDLVNLVGSPNENAHNNFVQVLAEQGLAGLAALFACLAVIVVGGFRAQLTEPDAVRGTLLIALVACLGTWVTGHPLLVPEFAFVFWLYAGILLGVTPGGRRSWPAWPVYLAMAALLLSVPFRVAALRNTADLEHRGFGLSLWQRDEAPGHREAGRTFSLYLPANGQLIDLPMRRAPGAPDPLIIDIEIGGRLINSVHVGGDAWQTLQVRVPESASRFELATFTVRPAAAGEEMPDTLLHVGRATVR